MGKKTGGPAFPVTLENRSAAEVEGFGGDKVPPRTAADYPGMTLRDYFAAKVMQGIASSLLFVEWTMHEIARCAYAHADAMLAASSNESAGTVHAELVGALTDLVAAVGWSMSDADLLEAEREGSVMATALIRARAALAAAGAA